MIMKKWVPLSLLALIASTTLMSGMSASAESVWRRHEDWERRRDNRYEQHLFNQDMRRHEAWAQNRGWGNGYGWPRPNVAYNNGWRPNPWQDRNDGGGFWGRPQGGSFWGGGQNNWHRPEYNNGWRSW